MIYILRARISFSRFFVLLNIVFFFSNLQSVHISTFIRYFVLLFGIFIKRKYVFIRPKEEKKEEYIPILW